MPYLFGYGSLINLSSLQNALRRSVNIQDVATGYLLGYERVWGAAEDVIYKDRGDEKSLFFDVRKRNGAYVNGILVGVTDEEFANLDKRERGYKRIDVSANIVSSMLRQDSKVYTYVCRTAGGTDDVSCIPYKYWELVCEGARKFGDRFLEELIETTEPIDPCRHEVVNEPYIFVDVEQNRYA